MSDYGVRACLVCGKEFEAKKPWALTCSEACREERKLILARRQGKKQREKTRAMLKDYKRLLAENEALKKRLADDEEWEYVLRYKGFIAEISYDEERQEFCGVTKNAGPITFVAKTEEELEREFVTSVETWIAVCKEKGIEIPAELLVDVAEMAKEKKPAEAAKGATEEAAPEAVKETAKPASGAVKPDTVKPASGTVKPAPETVKPVSETVKPDKAPEAAKPAPEKPVPGIVKPQPGKASDAVKPAVSPKPGIAKSAEENGKREAQKPDIASSTEKNGEREAQKSSIAKPAGENGKREAQKLAIARSTEENGERVIGDPATTRKFNRFVTTKKYRCVQCGTLFYPTGSRQKYCPECRAKRVGR